MPNRIRNVPADKVSPDTIGAIKAEARESSRGGQAPARAPEVSKSPALAASSKSVLSTSENVCMFCLLGDSDACLLGNFHNHDSDGHFHSPCLNEYLRKQLCQDTGSSSGRHLKCPICRQSIPLYARMYKYKMICTDADILYALWEAKSGVMAEQALGRMTDKRRMRAFWYVAVGLGLDTEGMQDLFNEGGPGAGQEPPIDKALVRDIAAFCRLKIGASVSPKSDEGSPIGGGKVGALIDRQEAGDASPSRERKKENVFTRWLRKLKKKPHSSSQSGPNPSNSTARSTHSSAPSGDFPGSYYGSNGRSPSSRGNNGGFLSRTRPDYAMGRPARSNDLMTAGAVILGLSLLF